MTGKQENVTPNQKTTWCKETTEMTESVEKDIKTTVINMFC